MKIRFGKWVLFAGAMLTSVISAEAQNSHRVVQVVYEVFSLSLTDAVDARRGGATDEVLYKKMLDGLESGKVKQEKFMSMRGQTGQVTTVSHTSEFIYATEFGSPSLRGDSVEAIPKSSSGGEESDAKVPKVSDVKSSAAKASVTPSLPHAFVTNNLGDSIEFEVALGVDSKHLNLRLSANHLSLVQLDSWGKGVSETKMPRFSRQRTNSSLAQVSGIPALVGTVSPAKEVQGENGDRVWFAFVTSRIIEVK